MRFSIAKPILRSFLGSASGAEFRIAPGLVEMRRVLRKDAEVFTWQWIQLSYASKSTSTYIEAGFCLHSPRLSTHPLDAQFLESLADMPPKMRDEVIALRRRLDGYVPYFHFSDIAPDDPLLNHRGPIDAWSEDSFVLYLLLVFDLAYQVGKVQAPAKTAEELLAWARHGAAQGLEEAIARRWAIASAA